jgi:teichoic acid transport system ATP-binding protein
MAMTDTGTTGFNADDTEHNKPTVIVDNLHVKFRIFTSGKAAKKSATRGRMGRNTREVHALKGISFVAHEGESIGVVGHNGSGKSTLMRSIAGLIPPAEGAVYASSRPSLLGVNAALMSELSGEKNVQLGTLALGMTPAEARSKYDEIVDFSGLGEFMDLPMRAYSSGMSARLRFAIAISKTHQILMVDEALAVGDKDFRSRSEERIRELRRQAGTVFLVSHSMKSILDTCNRVIWLDHGNLLMDGEPREVIDAYQASK